MAARDYVAGFQVAGGGKANVVDLSAAAAGVAAYGLEQAEETRKRQKEFDENRAAFKKEMADTYDQYVHENNFDDTGILDFDSSTEKLRNSIKQSHLETEFLYNQGTIDEAEVRRRNNEIKGQVGEIKNLSQDIVAYQDSVKKLEDEGKGSEVNNVRTDLLEAMSKNFNVVSTANGLQYQTIVDGEVKGVNASQFKKVLDAREGVNIQTDIDEIIKLGGFDEYVKGDKKIKDFTSIVLEEKGEAIGTAFDVSLAKKTDEQILDMMMKLGLADDDEKIAKDNNLRHIKGEDVFSFKATDDDRKKLKAKLKEELVDQLELKRQRTFYEDPKAILAYKKKLDNQKDPIHTQGMEKRVVTVTNPDGTEDKVENSFDTYMPIKISGKPSGIDISYTLQQTDSDSAENIFATRILRQMNDKLKSGEQTLGIDAIKKTTLLQGERNKNTGAWTFRVGIDLKGKEGFGDSDDALELVEEGGGSYSEVIEINPGTLKEVNMFYQNLTGKQLSDTSQKEFLKSLEAKKKAGEKLTPQESAALGKSGQYGSLINSKLKGK